MKPIKFDEANVVFGEGQEQYNPLPAYRHKAREGHVVTCWEMDEAERAEFAQTGRIWITQLTFNQPLQPLLVGTAKPLAPAPQNESMETPAVEPASSQATQPSGVVHDKLQNGETTTLPEENPDGQTKPFSEWLVDLRHEASVSEDIGVDAPDNLGRTEASREYWFTNYLAGQTPQQALEHAAKHRQEGCWE